MQLGSYTLVDPKTVRSFYIKNRLMTDILNKCNHQEYRYIDGYGKGYFLLTDNITSETVSFVTGTRTVNLKIIDKLWLEHPAKTDFGLYVYVTAEPKYYLQDIIVLRNYNIIIDKSLSLGSGPPTFQVYEVAGPLSMSQVMADILPVGYTMSFNAQDITSFDIAIEGMSAMKAIDHLCSIYGWVWTVLGTTVHVWDITPSDPVDPLNDIQSSLLSPQVRNIAVSFPYYDYPGYRKGTQEYYDVATTSSGQGLSLTTCDPYLPAISGGYGAVDEDSIRNGAALVARKAYIQARLEDINSLVRYSEKHAIETPQPEISNLITPISLSEVYGDWGDGPRSIYRSSNFPYVTPKIPLAKARFANNWRGTLVVGYQEEVAYFVVDPVYGFDGKIPQGYQRVVNVYGWSYGEVGWKIRVEWNPELAQWEAIQQEYRCPPDPLEPEPYDPPDYEPPYYFPGEE